MHEFLLGRRRGDQPDDAKNRGPRHFTGLRNGVIGQHILDVERPPAASAAPVEVQRSLIPDPRPRVRLTGVIGASASVYMQEQRSPVSHNEQLGYPVLTSPAGRALQQGPDARANMQ